MPKSSIAIAHAETLDLGQAARGRLDVAHQRRLGDLDRQRVGAEAAVAERLFDVDEQLVGVELAPGDVDGHRDLVAGVAPRARPDGTPRASPTCRPR